MGLKDFDFKDFMLKKGERVALGIAVAIMVLLITLGLILKGLGGSSAKANTTKLRDLEEQAKKANKTSAPGKDVAEEPPELARAVNPKALDPNLFPWERPVFVASALDDVKWREPLILAPDEFQADFMWAQVRANMLRTSKEGDQVGILVAPKGKSEAPDAKSKALDDFKKKYKTVNSKGYRQPTGPGAPGLPGGGGYGGNRPPGMGGMKGGGGMMGMGGGGMMGMGGGGMFGRGGGGGMQGNGLPGQDGNAKPPMDIAFEPADKLDKVTGEIAQVVLPYRIGIITAAFPYREQLKEFRKALRYPTVGAMLADKEVAIEFIGMNVKRRAIAADGKVGDWFELETEKPLKLLLVAAVGVEPEDKEMADFGLIARSVHGNRLVHPRPTLFRDQKYPEVQLESIKETVASLKKKGEAAAPPSKPRKSRFESKLDDILDEVPGEEPKPNPDPNFQGTLVNEQEAQEKCLVRIVDVTGLFPGYTYEYQVQVKMANPLYEKGDMAVRQDLTKDKYLTGPWQVVSKKITVPPESNFYAVDEKPEKTSRNFVQADQDKAAVQIHRWADFLQTDPKNNQSEVAVGDWIILERTLAYRGEYIGGEKMEEVEVPVWVPGYKEFVFAVHADDLPKTRGQRRTPKHRGIPVPFNTDHILVDFEGGKQNLLLGPKTVHDEGPVELLVFTPEGKMIVHNSRADTEDKTRQERYQAWKAFQTVTKQKTEEIRSGGTKADPLFGDKGKPPGR